MENSKLQQNRIKPNTTDYNLQYSRTYSYSLLKEKEGKNAVNFNFILNENSTNRIEYDEI